MLETKALRSSQPVSYFPQYPCNSCGEGLLSHSAPTRPWSADARAGRRSAGVFVQRLTPLARARLHLLRSLELLHLHSPAMDTTFIDALPQRPEMSVRQIFLSMTMATYNLSALLPACQYHGRPSESVGGRGPCSSSRFSHLWSMRTSTMMMMVRHHTSTHPAAPLAPAARARPEHLHARHS